MSKQTKGAAAPKRTTSRLAFERANAAGDLLFEVRPGVPATDALECASCYLAAAKEATCELAMTQSEGGLERIWAAYYLIFMAKAVVDAAIGVISDEEREPK
jgi:hypothetical protein